MVEFINMNILFFARLFYPHIGGVEKHVLEISRILIKKGHKITLVTEQHSPGLKLVENFESIKVYRIPGLKPDKNKKILIWKWLWQNRDLMKNADVIHCHDVFFWYLPFKFLFPLKKVFTTFHGYESYPLKSKNILIHKISEKLSDGNICIGDFLPKWYGTKPTHIEYGGVDLNSLNFKNSNKVKNESALFIGRLDEQTGILTYSKAIGIIKKKIPDFEFLVIGGGNLKSKISAGIKVVNPLSNAQDYLKNYNFAFVSRYLSILEAMAAKRLVFAVYDNPIKEDYLRMAPFAKYIEIFSTPDELVSRINFYLNNAKNKEEMIEKAYLWVKKHTWKEMADTYLRLWGK
jgi:glycosyltransferase involved in cell wall biosynthesis